MVFSAVRSSFRFGFLPISSWIVSAGSGARHLELGVIVSGPLFVLLGQEREQGWRETESLWWARPFDSSTAKRNDNAEVV
jgi:hypothetical protein